MNQFKIKKGLIVNGDGGTILDIQGSNGELFSVNDNFSGILFSVNNISGLPIMTVSSDNSIVMGQFGLNVLTLTGNSVGIGTASPTANLHVVGNARVTGAIFDSTNAPGTSGQVLTSTVTGTDWKSLAEISGVDGTGTANYLSKWADADTITNSIVYDNGTNVGIGTASPSYKTTIYDSSLNTDVLTVSNNQINGDYIQRFVGISLQDQYANGTGNASAIRSYSNLYSQWGSTLTFSTTGGGGNGVLERMRITEAGNVGIGTTSPGQKLEVNGNTWVSGTVYINRGVNSTEGYTYFDHPGTQVWKQGIFNDNTSTFSIGNGGGFTRLFNITNTGNVGIGTTNPLNLLHVSQASANTIFRLGNNASYDQFIYFNGGNDWSLGMDYSNSNAFVLSNASSIGTNDRVVVTTGGNVGIGTTAPTQGKLQVSGGIANSIATIAASFSGGANALNIGDDGTNAVLGVGNSSTDMVFLKRVAGVYSEAMRITSSGLVGIGTTSPGVYRLAVTSADYRVMSLDSTYGQMNMDFANSGVYFASIGSGNSQSSDAGILASDFGIGTVGSATNKIIFATGTGYATRMAILPSGNVGIGTTSPDRQLELEASTGAFLRLSSSVGSETAGNNIGKIEFYTNDADGPRVGGFIQTLAAETFGRKNTMIFGVTSSNNATATEALRIDENANVGIGTTAPAYKLDVSGTGRFTSSVTAVSALLQSANTNSVVDIFTLYNPSQASSGVRQKFANGYGDLAAIKVSQRDNGALANDGQIEFQVASDTSLDTKLTILNTGAATFSSSVTATNFLASNGGDFGWGDSSTRIDGDSSNQYIRAVINNSEKLRIAPSGNVGIGTTSPNSQLDAYTSQGGSKISTTHGTSGSYPKVSGISFGATSTSLTVSNNGSTTSFTGGAGIYANNTASSDNPTDLVFWNTSGGSPSERMRITSAGNVGIGTTAPVGILHLYKAAAATRLAIDGDAGQNRLISYRTGALQRFGLYVNNTAESGSNAGSNFAIRAYSDAGTLLSTPFFINRATGNVGIGTTAPGAKLDIAYSTNPTTATPHIILSTGGTVKQAAITAESSAVGGLVFSTGDGTLVDRMTILRTNGNVGIGTTAPGTKLQVDGTIRATGASGIVDVDPLYGAFRFYNGSTFYGGFYNDAVLSAGNAVDLVSYVATGNYYIGSATTAKAVKVEQGGNVGIGTTSPTTKLDVNGVVNATSFSAGGTAGFTGTVVFATNPPGSQMLDFQGGLLVSVS